MTQTAESGAGQGSLVGIAVSVLSVVLCPAFKFTTLLREPGRLVW
jgi:hypothetical protein